MTTLQKSYRDLETGEILVKGDQFLSGDLWFEFGEAIGCRALPASNDRYRRPIHRQPDGSWRDEGEEIRKVDLATIVTLIRSHVTDLTFEKAKEIAESISRVLNIPLEPEQEEWEMDYESYIKDYEVYCENSIEPPRKLTPEAFKRVWNLCRKAHERKQGGSV